MWRGLRARLRGGWRSASEADALRRKLDDALAREQAMTAALARTSAERDAYLRQRDVAIGERNAILAQRDDVIGRSNQRAAELDAALDRQAHRFRCRVLRAESGCPLAAPAEGRLIVFCHLAKTGGVTLSQTLQRNILSDEFPQIAMQPASAQGTWAAGNVDSALAALGVSGRARLKAIWGHIPASIDVPARDPYRVTLLREPMDRLLSVHFYVNRESREPFEVLLDDLRSALEDQSTEYVVRFDNGQTRVLSGRADLDPFEVTEPGAVARRVDDDDFASAAALLDRMAHVGVLHRYDEFVVLLAADLGWSLADVAYRRANETERRPAPSAIPAALRERIATLTRYDHALVERAERRLEARIADYSGRFELDMAMFRRLAQMHQDGATADALRATELEMLGRAYGGS